MTGVVRLVTGEGTVSPTGEVSGVVRVAAASVDTKNIKRDRHLRPADSFDSDRYPDIMVTVDGIWPSGQGVTVTGALSVRDRTWPMRFDCTAAVHADIDVRLDAEVHIDRAEYGLTWNQMSVASMNNTLTIGAIFTKW